VEALIYLDTHVVAWLYAGESRLLSHHARSLIEQNALRVSPMVVLELELLKEIGRLEVGGNAIFEHLHTRIGIEICDLSFPRIATAALKLTWTRDPFDRVIVGHAVAAGRPLLTKDRSIRRRFREAVW
jgi:PIN domain nuclease of toxin-antitoxin system